MIDLVNIVHPYSYKMLRNGDGFKLVCGDIEEFKERDTRVVEFVKTALDLRVKILRHDFPPKETLDWVFEFEAFEECPIYGEILFDEMIKEVFTLQDGTPIPNNKPTGMSNKDWNYSKSFFTLDKDLQRLIGNPDRTFYIWGFFEACVKNMAYYQRKNYTPGKEIFCIEELCASTNDEKTQEVRECLQKDGIEIITHKEAMELLQYSN